MDVEEIRVEGLADTSSCGSLEQQSCQSDSSSNDNCVSPDLPTQPGQIKKY